MFMCYLDESGVQENTGTSHFVLMGLAIRADQWKTLEAQIAQCKRRYGLEDREVHAAWLARRYLEQEKIPGFVEMTPIARETAAERERDHHLIRVAARKSVKDLKEAKLNYRKTKDYLHLTRDERLQLLRELADIVAGWQDARLFAEAIDKRAAYAQIRSYLPYEFAFTELVQRFEYFLRNRGNFLGENLNGILVQDNNETVAKRLTDMMRRFHREGTRWTPLDHIIETPLFVDSHLTSMVQMADLCAYATRRFYENGERDLFDRIYPRFDRMSGGVVGLRHFSAPGCKCRACSERA